MQSLASFFEDNKPLAYAASVAAAVVLIFVAFVLYRLLFGRRLRTGANGRTRQPRLGIVDAYELDRHRQLVLVRRDNVEHLIMIGGPTDVVVETAIIRNQAAGSPRDKDVAGPLVGAVAAPGTFQPAAPPPAALAPAAPQALPPAASNPLPAVARSEPAPMGRGEPAAPRTEMAPRVGGAVSNRTEPALGTPMPSPLPDRAPAERSSARPVAIPDPGAPTASGSSDPSPPPQPMRPAPPRPAGLPPRPAPGPAAPSVPVGMDRTAPGRPPLPPRPPVARPPLPPRPTLASSLPPRPPRPAPAPRSDVPQRPSEAARPEPALPSVPPSAPAAEPDAAREPEQGVQDAPAVPKNIEMLESLEEEMAKLLGRPAPRREN